MIFPSSPIQAECLTLPHPDSKVHGAYMGPAWGPQDPGGPHIGPMILAIWVTDDSLMEFGVTGQSCIDIQIRRVASNQQFHLK